jgi:FeS assembly SUF system regulator
MLRISRMADYALLMVFNMLSRDELITLDSLHEVTNLSLPTMRKLMRSLISSNLVESARGSKGGFRLSRPHDQISIAEVIEAIDGPIALTECAKLDGGLCELEDKCGLKENWNMVNHLISNTLHSVKLDAMAKVPIDIKRMKSKLIKILK